MEVTKNPYSDNYLVTDCNGNTVCSFPSLKCTVLVKRYICGEALTIEEENLAMGAIEAHDEEERRREEERKQKKEAKKERARERKTAKATQQEGGAIHE